MSPPPDSQHSVNSSPSRQLLFGSAALGGLLLAVTGILFWTFQAIDPAEEFKIAWQALRENRLTDVRRSIDRLERGRASDPDATEILKAGIAVKEQQYADALQFITPAAAQGGHRRQALLLLGESLFRVGRLDRAVVVLRSLTSEFPDDADAWRLLAATYYDLGAVNLSLAATAELHRLDPDDYRPFHLAAAILMDFEKYSDAAQQCAQALSRHPPEVVAAEIRIEQARALIRLRRYEDALQALGAQAVDPLSNALRAEALWSLGREAEARDQLNQIAAADQERPEVLRVQIKLELARGADQQARSALLRLLELEPYDLEARYQLVQTATKLQRKTEAEEQSRELDRLRSLQDEVVRLSEVANDHPEDFKVRERLAKLCKDLGRTELYEMWTRAAVQSRLFADSQPPASEKAAATPR